MKLFAELDATGIVVALTGVRGGERGKTSVAGVMVRIGGRGLKSHDEGREGIGDILDQVSYCVRGERVSMSGRRWARCDLERKTSPR